jgi:hypothetical protein
MEHETLTEHRGTIDMREVMFCLSTSTCTTHEVVTHCVQDIVRAREEMACTKGDQLLGGSRIDVVGLMAKITHCGETCMQQLLMPEKYPLLSEIKILVGGSENIVDPG